MPGLINTMPNPKQRSDSVVLERTKLAPKEPEYCKVLLLNDDYTTMEFVVEILETVFQKTRSEALRVMMQVHNKGHGVCGAYSHEVAETKVSMVHELARQHSFPLRASLEHE
jgi:ATP-dependent Clp protease adaptor protein ClpS